MSCFKYIILFTYFKVNLKYSLTLNTMFENLKNIHERVIIIKVF